jgi:hypothetical protein
MAIASIRHQLVGEVISTTDSVGQSLERVMAYVTYHRDLASSAGERPEAVHETPSALWRIFSSLFQARDEQRDAAIGAFIASSGGRLTDSIEREIERREMPNWGMH